MANLSFIRGRWIYRGCELPTSVRTFADAVAYCNEEFGVTA